MDPRVLDVIDKVLDNYLSSSKEELEKIVSESEDSFWASFFWEKGEFYNLTDTFVSNGSVIQILSLSQLDDLINSYSKFASNDDFYE
ncbi:TPA: hypothetical protein PXE99_002243, partial [Mannheimia haemolytica]|nr:hypothetical protein [Mannheimia haemolytica]